MTKRDEPRGDARLWRAPPRVRDCQRCADPNVHPGRQSRVDDRRWAMTTRALFLSSFGLFTCLLMVFTSLLAMGAPPEVTIEEESSALTVHGIVQDEVG